MPASPSLGRAPHYYYLVSTEVRCALQACHDGGSGVRRLVLLPTGLRTGLICPRTDPEASQCLPFPRPGFGFGDHALHVRCPHGVFRHPITPDVVFWPTRLSDSFFPSPAPSPPPPPGLIRARKHMQHQARRPALAQSDRRVRVVPVQCR